jgi:hypothetical protein
MSVTPGSTPVTTTEGLIEHGLAPEAAMLLTAIGCVHLLVGAATIWHFRSSRAAVVVQLWVGALVLVLASVVTMLTVGAFLAPAALLALLAAWAADTERARVARLEKSGSR